MMSRRNPLLGLLGACSLALALTSCAEITKLLPPSGPPLATSTNPAIKAAGEASDAVDKEQQAQVLLNTAIATKNTKPVDEAIKLRPTDPTYLVTLFSLQIAFQQKADLGLIQQAKGLVISQHPELTVPEKLQLTYIYLLDALITTNKFPKGTPEWTRLREGYCGTLADYHDFLGERADLLYSIEGCPAAKPGP